MICTENVDVVGEEGGWRREGVGEGSGGVQHMQGWEVQACWHERRQWTACQCARVQTHRQVPVCRVEAVFQSVLGEPEFEAVVKSFLGIEARVSVYK